jgi:hypothetical protein
LSRYFLSMTRALLPASEVEAATALGRSRFNVLFDQIVERLGTDGPLPAKLIETLAQADQERAATSFDE